MPEQHCWDGRRETIEREHGMNSPEYIRTYDPDWKDGICLLEDGHDGEHEYIDTDKIMLRFTGAGDGEA